MSRQTTPAEVTPDWRKPVVRMPLTQAFPQFEQVREFKSKICLFNEDRTKVFDVVSDRYQLVEHGKAIDAVEKALVRHFGKGKAPTFNIRSLNGGARIRGEVKLPIPGIRLGKNDYSELTLLARNSYDRSCPFYARLGAFRLICSNGAKVGETFGEINARHVGDSDLLGDGNDSILDQLGEIIKRAPMVKQVWEEWADTKVTREDAEARLQWLPAMYRTPILEEANWAKGGRSMWQFYNDLTHMSTHLTRSLNRRMDFDDRIASMFYDGQWDAIEMAEED